MVLYSKRIKRSYFCVQRFIGNNLKVRIEQVIRQEKSRIYEYLADKTHLHIFDITKAFYKHTAFAFCIYIT